jgi:CheY-like chemotaxis protein
VTSSIKKCCLVIEDETDTARYICNGLREVGFDVSWSQNSIDGLNRAADEKWDVVILDRLLPGSIDGLSIVQQMRDLGKSTPVLVLSALASLDERVRGLRSGGDDYLTKPFDFSELLARMVFAPIDGVVTQRQVGLGQYINSAANGGSSLIFSIGDMTKVWLLANVHEDDAPSMRVGQPVEVHVLAFPGRRFSAKLTYVAASIDPNTHRLPVRAEVENPDGALKPEMFASFSIIIGNSVDSPAVPEEGVVYEGETARVWIVGKDKTLSLRQIRPGWVQDGMVQVLDGVQAGEQVVTSGSLFIDRAAHSDPEEQLHSACAQIGVAVANMLPNITLSGTGGSQALALSQMFAPGTGYFTLAAALTQPIFEVARCCTRREPLELVMIKQQPSIKVR